MAGQLLLARREESEEYDLLDQIIEQHANHLVAQAKRYSLCQDDAHDAYQRALEIYLRHAGSLRRDTALSWLYTVVKHEALALRKSRMVVVDEVVLENANHDYGAEVTSIEEYLDEKTRVKRAKEALGQLKTQERKALFLQAQGYSYKQIADLTGWTYTKVNRSITEGRKSFLTKYAGLESGNHCAEWFAAMSKLVDEEVGEAEQGELQGHLEHCANCRLVLKNLKKDKDSISITALQPFLFWHSGLLTKIKNSFSLFSARSTELLAPLTSADLLSSAKTVSTVIVGALAVSFSIGGAFHQDTVNTPKKPSVSSENKRKVSTPVRSEALVPNLQVAHKQKSKRLHSRDKQKENKRREAIASTKNVVRNAVPLRQQKTIPGALEVDRYRPRATSWGKAFNP